MELNMVYVVSERPAVGLSGPMADPEVLSSEDTAKSRLALYPPCRFLSRAEILFRDLRELCSPFVDCIRKNVYLF